MATVSSTFGGLFSVIVLVFFAPFLAQLAYEFGQPEYFALAIFGLTMLASIGEGSPIKNLIAGAFGILISTVGKDFMTSIDRFTFGINELTEGIGFIPVVVGLFAMSEMLIQSTLLKQIFNRVALKAVKLPTFDDYKLTWKTILRSSGIGSFIGVLPAEGGTVASLIGYSEAKRWSKNPEKFGKGSIEGVAGAEAANNAATGGAMVPTLALGIPGSATTAVILTGLIIHGVRPGPSLFREQPDFLYGIFGAMLVANILFFILGFFGAKIFARITLVPNRLLWPMIFAVSVCGTYSLSQSLTDVWIMLFFGVLGFFMRRYGFSVVPVIIGLILGELVEGTLRQSLVIFDGNWLMFLSRPIALTFFILALIALLFPLLKEKKMNKIDLSNKVAVVTGGAQGFGLAICKKFIESGASVIIWDIDKKATDESLKAINSKKCFYQNVDVTNFSIIEKKLNEIESQHKKIDIFVNNAGITGMNAKVWEYPVEEWEKVMNLDLNATFYCCKAVVPFMIKNNYGRIVNISSIAGKEGNPNASAYSTAKAGVIGLTKSLGKELADKNIAVNCVTPAAAKTRIFDQMTKEAY